MNETSPRTPVLTPEQIAQREAALASEAAFEGALESHYAAEPEPLSPSALDSESKRFSPPSMPKKHRSAYRPAGPPDIKHETTSDDRITDTPGLATPLGRRFETVEQLVYKNGAEHVYGKDANGKLRHLSHDEILKFYGHEGGYGKDQVILEARDEVQDTETDTNATEHPRGKHRKAETEEETTPIYDNMARETEHVGRHRSQETDAREGGSRSVRLGDLSDAEVSNWFRRGSRHNYGEEPGLDEGTSEEVIPLEEIIPLEEVIPLAEAIEPIEDSTPAGMKDRLRRMFGNAADKRRDINAWVATRLSMREATTPEEVERVKSNRRKAIIGAVVGAVIVGAVAYLELKGTGVSQHAQNQGPNNGGGHNPGLSGGNHNPSSGAGVKQPTNPGLAQPSGGKKLPTSVTLKSGDNPWNIGEHRLNLQGNPDPTNAQIQAEDMKIGKANGYSTWSEWAKKAHHLTIGSKLKMPKG